LPILILSVFAILAGESAVANEQPHYDVLQRYESFELRRYAPYNVAETQVTGDFETVGNEAFRILAGYIFGNNEGGAKIAMTAPVNQMPVPGSGEKIAMTEPVSQSPQADAPGTYTFTFMMPSAYALENLPRPTDSRVRLRRIDGRLMAARTYSGTWSEERYREHETALLHAVRAAGLRPVGVPVFARYNSPFTLWFLRRNEVLVEIGPEGPVPPAKR
jgi:hypothetical protein